MSSPRVHNETCDERNRQIIQKTLLSIPLDDKIDRLNELIATTTEKEKELLAKARNKSISDYEERKLHEIPRMLECYRAELERCLNERQSLNRPSQEEKWAEIICCVQESIDNR